MASVFSHNNYCNFTTDWGVWHLQNRVRGFKSLWFLHLISDSIVRLLISKLISVISVWFVMNLPNILTYKLVWHRLQNKNKIACVFSTHTNTQVLIPLSIPLFNTTLAWIAGVLPSSKLLPTCWPCSIASNTAVYYTSLLFIPWNAYKCECNLTYLLYFTHIWYLQSI